MPQDLMSAEDYLTVLEVKLISERGEVWGVRVRDGWLLAYYAPEIGSRLRILRTAPGHEKASFEELEKWFWEDNE